MVRWFSCRGQRTRRPRTTESVAPDREAWRIRAKGTVRWSSPPSSSPPSSFSSSASTPSPSA